MLEADSVVGPDVELDSSLVLRVAPTELVQFRADALAQGGEVLVEEPSVACHADGNRNLGALAHDGQDSGSAMPLATLRLDTRFG